MNEPDENITEIQSRIDAKIQGLKRRIELLAAIAKAIRDPAYRSDNRLRDIRVVAAMLMSAVPGTETYRDGFTPADEGALLSVECRVDTNETERICWPSCVASDGIARDDILQAMAIVKELAQRLPR